ncbi:MAG: hypothetical protein GYA55_11620 [SAR324 cluster bacterium]|uniref:Uncharacterized protein n=1 Tax=SAR324 cluster bacterium TaxID=2024889 RepID=A0A7X9FTC8_9DELT|nr:hypothetical protein [SAR324 cluster bacterium]
MAFGSDSAAKLAFMPWNPENYLKKCTRIEVAYSRGFLQCMPQHWFPGLAAQWLPLFHALGVDFHILGVKTTLSLPADLSFKCGYKGEIEGEPLVLYLDKHAVRAIQDSVSPNGIDVANSIIIEYLARRILGSFAFSWTASEFTALKYQSMVDSSGPEGIGFVKLSIRINSDACDLWFCLGSKVVDRMDGLWRRQLLTRSKTEIKEEDFIIEIAQLGVEPTAIAKYVRSGTPIDLETIASDRALLRSKNGDAIPIRLVDMDGELAIELNESNSAPMSVSPGTTRLSISLGRLSMDANLLSELRQPGALWSTGLSLSDQTQIVINNEKVADASLGVYQGRFAVNVK